MTLAQVDWTVQMLAAENPEQIQVTKAGEPIPEPEKIKTLTYVDAYNTMRSASKQEFINNKIPPKLREALKARKEMKEKITQLQVNTNATN